MSQNNLGVIELGVQLRGDHADLIEWLEDRGISEYVEASCDFIDASGAEAAELVARYERGEVQLPLLIYSYEREWIDQLCFDLRASFGSRLLLNERRISDQLWQKAWEPDFRLLETERFLILPEDLPLPDAESPKKLIRLASGSIFGSGQHASTQAMVRLLEGIEDRHKGGGRLLDVGTGTGVLGFVGHYLGFTSIVATDIEPDALRVAAHNQGLNKISFELLMGTLPSESEGFDVVVCNILPPTLTNLLPELVKTLHSGGLLYLAGLNEANEAPVLKRVAELGLRPIVELFERGWAARCWQK